MNTDMDKLKDYIIKYFMNNKNINPVSDISIGSVSLNDFTSDSEPDEIYSRINNSIDEEELFYKYLDDDILSKEFSNERDFSQDYHLKLCLFSMNQHLQRPFVEYHFVYKDGQFQFPEAVLLKDLFQNIVQPDNSSSWFFPDPSEINTDMNNTIDTIFLEQAIETFKYNTKLSHTDGVNSYRGFINHENDIFVFFDCSKLNIVVNNDENNKLYKGLLSDLRLGSLYNKSIETNSVHIFNEYPFLSNIKDRFNNNIENPISGYLCDYENNVYQNVLKENDKISLITEKVEHDLFGYMYLFSEKPLIDDINIKRYALFVTPNIPVLEDVSENSDENQLNITELSEKYTTFYFHHQNHKMIGIYDKTIFVEL